MQISEFELDQDWSIPRRIAEFLIWADARQPMHFISYGMVTRAVYGLKAKGKVGDDLVEGVRRRISAVNKLLHKEYKKAIVTAMGGVRVTHDHDDAANTALRRRMGRLASAKRAVVDTVTIIDTKAMKNPQLKAYVEREARDVVRTLASPAFEQKLIPPPIGEDD